MSWMKKLLRFVGSTLAVLIALRVVDSLVAPVLPLVVDIFVTGIVIYVATNGIKRGL